jgi:hypothetical protein
VGFTEGSDVAGVDVDVNFDPTQFSSVTVDCSVQTVGAGTNFCSDSNAGTGTIDVILARFDQTAFPTGLLANITFTIDNAATAGSKPLDGVMVGVSDTGGTDLPLDTVTVIDGAINVLGAAYASSPAPGETINIDGLQGGANPAQDVIITNTGVAGTTLSVTCSTSGDAVFAVTPDTNVDIAQGASGTMTVSCDASAAIGQYTGQMSCTHNGDGTGEASPAVYPLVCNLLDAPPAVFSSNPAAGSTTDMTAGLDVIAGGTVPVSGLVFTNTAAAGSKNLNVSCTAGISSEITAAPAPGGSAAPGETIASVVSCDATNAGSFSETFACIYTTDGTQPAVDNGTAVDYTYTCDVREPQATVDPTPASPGTITELAQPGGSADFAVVFSEVGGEGVDGALDSCSLATGTDFTITDPNVYPAAVPAGGSTVVTVVGTDPGGVESTTDTLTCVYIDGNDESTTVTYTLLLEVGGDAGFEVSKVFSDGRPGSVDVTITCNTGLPLTQTATISDGNPVFFIVKSFESGDMDCSVTEDPDSGYEAEFAASGDSNSVDDDPLSPGCHFTEIGGGDSNACAITNTPDPVAVVIEKEWIMAGASQGGVSTSYMLTLWCDSEIIGGTQGTNGGTSAPNGINDWHLMFYGDGSDVFTAMVVPNFPSSSCWVEENIQDNAVETVNGCTDISVSVGNPAACTITNTVFFEGIPTLNQYGLAIMALLMLGIGMVGFRRFT